MINRACKTIVFLACAALLQGCVGYRLGSMLPPDVKTVFIPTFINKTTEPLVDVETTRATTRQVQLDGSLKLAAEQEADTILEVTVHGYDLSPIAYDKGRQRTLADEYRLTLTASVLLKRRMTGEIIVENPSVRGDVTFEVGGSLAASKRNALPGAADDLGRRIVRQIVEVW
jgi:hypothetical protein